MPPYSVVLTTPFKKSVKRLKKRHRNINKDMHLAISTLTTNPYLGQIIQGASGIRKLRVRNTDLKKGKSGGYRLLYYAVDEPSQILYLLLVYVKSDKADVTQRELKSLLDELGYEYGINFEK